jgi:DNA modification methylase
MAPVKGRPRPAGQPDEAGNGMPEKAEEPTDGIAAKRAKIRDLVPDEKNANLGTERGRKALIDSLRQYGAGRSILLDRDGRIIAGNKTAEQAAGIGFDEVIVVETDGSQLVAVKRTDLDLEDGPEARMLAYYDNRVGELDLEWNTEALAADLAAGLNLSGLWDAAELAKMLNEKKEKQSAPEAKVDLADELQKKWGTSLGQLWVIPSRRNRGEHRIICGDSTDPKVVARLMAGEPAGIMVTDPPYGVEYDPTWRAEAGINKNVAKMGAVENDSRVDWSAAYRLFPGDVAYVWHSAKHTAEVQTSLEAVGFEAICQIIWVKDRFALSRGNYHWQHEPCWYSVRRGGGHGWSGSRNQSTVWEIERADDSGHGHGTQKPLGCMERPIRNHIFTVVYDPFLGAGTTLVACERLARLGRGGEILPQYVAVSLERMADMGLEPRLAEGPGGG